MTTNLKLIDSQNSTRVIDPTAGMETITNYKELPRELLEQKARFLDSIELQLAACYHGTVSYDELVASMLMTFERADFKNYFNQEFYPSTPMSELLRKVA